MPRGPRGEKRPAKPMAEVVEEIGTSDGKDPAARALGKKGGAARRDKLTPERRQEIARKAARSRWWGKGAGI